MNAQRWRSPLRYFEFHSGSILHFLDCRPLAIPLMYDWKQGALLISICVNFRPERRHHESITASNDSCGIHQRNQLTLRTQDIHVNCGVNLIQSYSNSHKPNKSFQQFCNPNSLPFCSRSLMIVLVCQTFLMIWCMEIWDDWYCYL
jgi:hypothetical protein